MYSFTPTDSIANAEYCSAVFNSSVDAFLNVVPFEENNTCPVPNCFPSNLVFSSNPVGIVKVISEEFVNNNILSNV